jgi:hypothetical protein
MVPIKLVMRLAKLANKYKGTILHAADTDLLTEDLGDALRRQKKIITDPDMGTIETASEALPVIAEVKVLTAAVSRKLGIDTHGKPTVAVLEEIIRKTEERNSDSAAEIQNTLDWTRSFFSQPEIQKILKADLIEIERPSGITDVGGMGRTAMTSVMRVTQELSRLNDFLKKAKAPPAPPKKPQRKKGQQPGL